MGVPDLESLREAEALEVGGSSRPRPGALARAVQPVGERHLVVGEDRVVLHDVMLGRVARGEEARDRRVGPRRRRVGVREHHAGGGDGIEEGRQPGPLAARREAIRTQRVDQDDDDVGRRAAYSPRRRRVRAPRRSTPRGRRARRIVPVLSVRAMPRTRPSGGPCSPPARRARGASDPGPRRRGRRSPARSRRGAAPAPRSSLTEVAVSGVARPTQVEDGARELVPRAAPLVGGVVESRLAFERQHADLGRQVGGERRRQHLVVAPPGPRAAAPPRGTSCR